MVQELLPSLEDSRILGALMPAQKKKKKEWLLNE